MSGQIDTEFRFLLPRRGEQAFGHLGNPEGRLGRQPCATFLRPRNDRSSQRGLVPQVVRPIRRGPDDEPLHIIGRAIACCVLGIFALTLTGPSREVAD